MANDLILPLNFDPLDRSTWPPCGRCGVINWSLDIANDLTPIYNAFYQVGFRDSGYITITLECHNCGLKISATRRTHESQVL